MNNKLISVIVPVYNVEKYIKRCLDSIINQTYKNLEVILIDDGSTDESGKICDEYEKKDNRIKVIHQNNSGVASSRNIGIENSSGLYITFIDSDDFVEVDYIEILFKEIMNNDCDVSTCLYNKYSDKLKRKRNIDYVVSKYSGKKALLSMLYQKNIDSSLWGKMYKSKLLKSIKINNYKVFEDFDALYRIFNSDIKVCFINDYLYNYYVRLDSLIHDRSTYSEDILLQILNKYYVECNDKDIKDAIESRMIDVHFSIICNLPHKDDNYNISKKYIICNRKKLLHNKMINKKTKYAIIISYISFTLLKVIYNLAFSRN